VNRALVVGGLGFLGSHVVAALVSCGVRVTTYSRRPVASRPRDFVALTGDILERDRLRKAMEGADYVFHFAWTTVPQTSNENPEWDVQSNVVGSLALLETCCDAGVRRVIFASSGGTVYGGTSRELWKESSPTEPICSYGITKLAVEKYLALYRRTRGLDYRVLRISNAYGEGQRVDRPQGLIAVALEKAAAGEAIEVWGDGSVIRDYVYVGDIAECCVKACVSDVDEYSPRTFNVSTGVGHSVREVIAAIERVSGRHVNTTYGTSRSCDADRVVLSNRLALERLDWAPRTTLVEGLARTWNWVLQVRSGAISR
jgi:UDP-glucose 4-epimerase